MKKEDTKEKILDVALLMFSKYGYDAVTVDDIAKEVGIKAPSLYNHFRSKRAIFDALFSSTATMYEENTEKVNVHVADANKDISVFVDISEEMLFEKVKQIFEYSLHNEKISRFRKMMTIEQFRSSDISKLFSERYVNRFVNYHAQIFSGLIEAGRIINQDPYSLALMYVSPLMVLIGECDRDIEKEKECLEKLKKHVSLFFNMVNRANTK